MEFDLNDEQRALRDEARRFLEAEAPTAYARAMMDDDRGWRDDVWRHMAGLGFMALPFPETYGGVGQGFIALTILLAEMGRVVAPGPYFSSVVMAGHAVLEAGTESQRKELLPAIAAGETIATLAFDEKPARWDANGIALKATPSGGAFTITGEKRFVTDGTTAERFIVAARAGGEVGLFVTEPGAHVTATPVVLIDQTRRVADVRFDSTRAELLGDLGWVPVQRVLDRIAAGLAAEMLGGAERVLELSVAYAKDRVQFDRPIGSFQAVKHRAADMLLDVESLRSAVYYAAWALERDHADASLAASMAKAYASDAFRRVAASGIQIHGGIGFTWEHDMHLYFKRAKVSEAAFGDGVWHRERMAQLLRPRYVQ
ncbi:MAG: acyl-CoA dehydrogenase family protein [Actinomycetota bacterium]|nr:acyl-CoA/acyl-ACP dehydrogenase [Actinomycetota bacterium]